MCFTLMIVPAHLYTFFSDLADDFVIATNHGNFPGAARSASRMPSLLSRLSRNLTSPHCLCSAVEIVESYCRFCSTFSVVEGSFGTAGKTLRLVVVLLQTCSFPFILNDVISKSSLLLPANAMLASCSLTKK